MKFGIFLKRNLLFNSFHCLSFINKTLRLNNLKTRTAMNAKISVFAIYVEAIIYTLYNLHDCTFNNLVKIYPHLCFLNNFVQSFASLRVLTQYFKIKKLH